MTPAERRRVQVAVREIVAAAPPLTDEQRWQISALLAPRGRRPRRSHGTSTQG